MRLELTQLTLTSCAINKDIEIIEITLITCWNSLSVKSFPPGRRTLHVAKTFTPLLATVATHALPPPHPMSTTSNVSLVDLACAYASATAEVS